MAETANALWLDEVIQRSAVLGLEARVRGTFEPGVRALVASAPGQPPPPGSAADEALLTAAVRLLTALPELGPEFLGTLTDVADEAFEDLLHEEYATADVLRKLVVHQLREAVRSYASFGRAAALRLQRVDLTAWAALVAAEIDTLPLPKNGRHYFRGWAALLIATTRMREPTGDVTGWAEWAQLAARCARKSEPSMQLWLEQFEAELTELRAKSAWRDWTAEDVAEEFAPWPDESSP